MVPGFKCEEYVLDFSRYITFSCGLCYEEWLLGNSATKIDPPIFREVELTQEMIDKFWETNCTLPYLRIKI